MQMKNAKAKEKPYKLADGGGLYLAVFPTGSKLWRMKHRQADGKETVPSFGAYPAVSLEQARALREDAKKTESVWHRPWRSQETKKRERAEKAANTFEKIARDWHANRLDTWQPSTAIDTINRLEKDVFPEIGNLPL